MNTALTFLVVVLALALLASVVWLSLTKEVRALRSQRDLAIVNGDARGARNAQARIQKLERERKINRVENFADVLDLISMR